MAEIKQFPKKGPNDAILTHSSQDRDASLLASLARLPWLEYQRARINAAKRLGIRAAILDGLVAKLRDAATEQLAPLREELREQWGDMQWMNFEGRRYFVIRVGHRCQPGGYGADPGISFATVGGEDPTKLQWLVPESRTILATADDPEDDGPWAA